MALILWSVPSRPILFSALNGSLSAASPAQHMGTIWTGSNGAAAISTVVHPLQLLKRRLCIEVDRSLLMRTGFTHMWDRFC